MIGSSRLEVNVAVCSCFPMLFPPRQKHNDPRLNLNHRVSVFDPPLLSKVCSSGNAPRDEKMGAFAGCARLSDEPSLRQRSQAGMNSQSLHQGRAKCYRNKMTPAASVAQACTAVSRGEAQSTRSSSSSSSQTSQTTAQILQPA